MDVDEWKVLIINYNDFINRKNRKKKLFFSFKSKFIEWNQLLGKMIEITLNKSHNWIINGE